MYGTISRNWGIHCFRVIGETIFLNTFLSGKNKIHPRVIYQDHCYVYSCRKEMQKIKNLHNRTIYAKFNLHPSIICHHSSYTQGRMGGDEWIVSSPGRLDPIPAIFGERRAKPWTCPQFSTGLTWREKRAFTFISYLRTTLSRHFN